MQLLSTYLPKDTILFISGASGVGKSSIARNMLKYIPEFLIIEELDLIREAIRANNNLLKDKLLNMLDEQQIENLLQINIIMKSTSLLSIEEMEQQCKVLLPPLKSVCKRIRKKAIPSIIEGVNISFNTLFEDKDNFFSLSNNMFFINLYASNSEIHKQRIDERFFQREGKNIGEKEFANIRHINNYLYLQTQKQINMQITGKKNIYNIDTTVEHFSESTSEINFICKTIADYITI